MNHLLRTHAPISERGWQLIDEEATSRLQTALAARKLVDFSGPHGYEHAALNVGRSERLGSASVEGIEASQRQVRPLVEVRAPFALSRAELLDADRGARDLDLGPLDEAASRIARSENVAVFHGWAEAGIVGIADAAEHEPIGLGVEVGAYPRHIAKAVEVLRGVGVGGPYGLALGPEGYTAVVETAEHGGFLLFEHLRRILGGPIAWAPGLEGALVVSLRGGDFVFESGEDLSIGYDRHDAENVHLYVEETFTFQVLSSDAAVALRV